MSGRADFECMRCGHLFSQEYDPRAPLTEWTCPLAECRSNSIRLLEGGKAARGPAGERPPAGGDGRPPDDPGGSDGRRAKNDE